MHHTLYTALSLTVTGTIFPHNCIYRVSCHAIPGIRIPRPYPSPSAVGQTTSSQVMMMSHTQTAVLLYTHYVYLLAYAFFFIKLNYFRCRCPPHTIARIYLIMMNHTLFGIGHLPAHHNRHPTLTLIILTCPPIP